MLKWIQLNLPNRFSLLRNRSLEACVAEWLTPRTPDLEVRGSSLDRRVVSLNKGTLLTLSLFIQVYKWVPVTYCLGLTLRWTIIPSTGGRRRAGRGVGDKFRPFRPLARVRHFLFCNSFFTRHAKLLAPKELWRQAIRGATVLLRWRLWPLVGVWIIQIRFTCHMYQLGFYSCTFSALVSD